MITASVEQLTNSARCSLIRPSVILLESVWCLEKEIGASEIRTRPLHIAKAVAPMYWMARKL